MHYLGHSCHKSYVLSIFVIKNENAILYKPPALPKMATILDISQKVGNNM